MAGEVTAEERARLRQEHVSRRLGICVICATDLPCLPHRLLDALEAAEALAHTRLIENKHQAAESLREWRGNHQALIDALEAAEVLAELRGQALEAVEWASVFSTGPGFCPWCRAGEEAGHFADCLRQRALGLEVKHE